jgi:hypothetical protein
VILIQCGTNCRLRETSNTHLLHRDNSSIFKLDGDKTLMMGDRNNGDTPPESQGPRKTELHSNLVRLVQ